MSKLSSRFRRSRQWQMVLAALAVAAAGGASAAGPDAATARTSLSGLAEPFIAPIVRLLGLPRDDHQRFLRAMREAHRHSPALLVKQASEALAAGNPQRALADARAARAILQDPRHISMPLKTRFGYWASASFFIGQSLRALRDPAGALAAFADTVVLAKATMRLDPGETAMRGLLAASEVNIGGLRFDAGDRQGATAHFRAASDFIIRLLDEDEGNRDLQHMLAATDRALGDLLRRGGDFAGSLAALRQARAREAVLAGLDARDAEAWLGQARDDSAIADILEASGDHAGALLAYQDARQALSDFHGPEGGQPSWRFAVAESLAGIGTVQESLGAFAEAAAAQEEARAILISLVPLPNAMPAVRALGTTDARLGAIHEKRREFTDAAEAYRDSLDSFATLIDRDPGDDDALGRLIASYGRLGAVRIAAGDQAAALGAYREAHDAVAALPGRDADPKVQRDLAFFSFQIGKLLLARRDTSGALRVLRESLRRFQAAAARAPKDAELHRNMWTVGGEVGTLLQARGDLVGALAAYRDSATALMVARDSAPQDPQVQKAFGVSVDRIGSVGYLLLLARDFRRSLAAEDFALTLAPGVSWLVGNRAHALMFLGRTQEARALYLGHRQEKYPDGKSWDDGTKADFSEMRKAGLHDPLMDEIEKTFAASR